MEILLLLLMAHADALMMMIMVIMTMKWCKERKWGILSLLAFLPPAAACMRPVPPILLTLGTSSPAAMSISFARSLK